ncbi:hypothetical protein ACFQFG_11350 [Methylobacterium persicinum]
MTAQAGSVAPAGHRRDADGMTMDQADTDGMGMADMAMDDMPCCPHEKATVPDCGKGCPMMALCLASVASVLPTEIPVPVPFATRASLSWPDLTSSVGIRGTPLPEPPEPEPDAAGVSAGSMLHARVRPAIAFRR